MVITSHYFNVCLMSACVNRGLTYKDSGVDIAAGNHLVDLIKPLAKATTRAGRPPLHMGHGGSLYNSFPQWGRQETLGGPGEQVR